MSKVLSGLYLGYAAIIFIALMIMVLPLILLASALLSNSAGRKTILLLIRCWAWAFSSFSLFWMITVNKKKVNKHVPHIYVGNHGSYLDAVAVCIGIPQHFSPLGKIEMTKIPIFGIIYQRIVVMIDRSSKESREKSVATLKNEIANGSSILIFPEGTMNTTSAPLSEFYDGAFKIAIETQTAIQPFVMLNNRMLLPRTNPLRARPGFIKIIFTPEMDVNGLTLADLPFLKEKVFKLMEEKLDFASLKTP